MRRKSDRGEYEKALLVDTNLLLQVQPGRR